MANATVLMTTYNNGGGCGNTDKGEKNTILAMLEMINNHSLFFLHSFTESHRNASTLSSYVCLKTEVGGT